MKRHLLTLAVAMLTGGTASAQTADTTVEAEGTYGTTWSDSIGSTFYSDSEMKTMRTPEEIGTSWKGLTQEDRDSVLAECARYRTESGTSATTETGTGATTGADATVKTETGTGTGVSTTAEAGAATSGISVSGENMKMLCDIVEAN